jgi:glycosyltransferase involved in cell wall biosynthesis
MASDKQVSLVMPSSPSPIISIGVPVYNGSRFLRGALESFLGQSFSDIELIISDNASTDATEDICREFAMRDARIRYVRQAVNIGAMRNWNFVAKQARGRFFKWSSANDYCSPDMLAHCFAAMEPDPRIVLCFPRTCLVDQETGSLTEYEEDIELMEDSPYERFGKVRESLRLNNPLIGLIRTDSLLRTRLNRVYPGGDMVLTAELALSGRFLLLPEILLYRRVGQETSSNRLSPEEERVWLDPLRTSTIGSPLLSLHLGYIGAALRAPINLSEKLKTLRSALRSAAWDREKIYYELRRAQK